MKTKFISNPYLDGIREKRRKKMGTFIKRLVLVVAGIAIGYIIGMVI